MCYRRYDGSGPRNPRNALAIIDFGGTLLVGILPWIFGGCDVAARLIEKNPPSLLGEA